jgi:hypothetical protein
MKNGSQVPQVFCDTCASQAHRRADQVRLSTVFSSLKISCILRHNLQLACFDSFCNPHPTGHWHCNIIKGVNGQPTGLLINASLAAERKADNRLRHTLSCDVRIAGRISQPNFVEWSFACVLCGVCTVQMPFHSMSKHSRIQRRAIICAYTLLIFNLSALAQLNPRIRSLSISEYSY